ncbi:MAG: hypothetical protein GF401_04300 [Chitinivibrionales bacterium]|nr:hypothetical protein [Chitinivibrionales bacterium]
MPPVAKETTPVSIGNDVRYTGFFLFSCLPSLRPTQGIAFAAKRKTPTIQAPYLRLKRPPVQKTLPGDFGGELYHIKKEFDEEGEDSENGVSGIQAYYFGARYYDPEIGVWFSCDKAGQFYNPYAYAGNGANPVVMVDKDGNILITTSFLINAGLTLLAVTGYYIHVSTNNLEAGMGADDAWNPFLAGWKWWKGDPKYPGSGAANNTPPIGAGYELGGRGFYTESGGKRIYSNRDLEINNSTSMAMNDLNSKINIVDAEVDFGWNYVISASQLKNNLSYRNELFIEGIPTIIGTEPLDVAMVKQETATNSVECDYCGNNYDFTRLTPDRGSDIGMPGLFDFGGPNGPCANHDLRYTTPYFSKTKADDLFRLEMRLNDNSPFKIISEIYYQAVARGGDKYYDIGQRNALGLPLPPIIHPNESFAPDVTRGGRTR